MSGIALWITGLPGSGKSTVAYEIQKRSPGFIILGMDELRKIVTPDPVYSDSERDIVYRSLVYLASKLAELGNNVIIDATGNRRRWRELARKHIPLFLEIYLKCPVGVCIERENARTVSHHAPRDIYKKGLDGSPVPGITVPYEEPANPDLLIETDKTSLSDIIARVETEVQKIKNRGLRSDPSAQPEPGH